MQPGFRNRTEAGRAFAEKLKAYQDRKDVLVLALPRGGVPVGFEVARVLHAPLDVFLVRKLGVPGHQELAFGAIASGGMRVLNHELIVSLKLSRDTIDAVSAQQQKELERREQEYRGTRTQANVEGRTAILIDDGLATGASMHAAVRALRLKHPKGIVVAVPVASPSTSADFKSEADAVVCVFSPEPFYAVGEWYDDFNQTTDEEVKALLDQAAQAENGSRQTES